MILASSLWSIPFHQHNHSFQFYAGDKSRCLFFPVFSFVWLCFLFSVFVFFLYSSLKWGGGGVKVLTLSRHDCLETMKFEYIFGFIIVSLSVASRSLVMLLFILRLKCKDSALTASCCY